LSDFKVHPSRVNPVLYMTTHQQDSSQPQQSHDSPHERTGEGLMMEETEEATLPGMVMVLNRGCRACYNVVS
jgi:hypothetical protein|tara:strand:- start:4418 stop:4633 length:216 start_codon:yes stop_codon:yes gene_type:complete